MKSRVGRNGLAALLGVAVAGAAAARANEPDAKPAVPSIQDNSFLIEEAYNQERGIVQTIQTFSWSRASGDWVYSLTQEWPVPDERHQLSFALPVAHVSATGDARGVGDLALNYRYQLLGNGEARVAIAPRATLLVPTGNEKRGLGTGGWGVQMSVPVSLVLSDRLVTHGNIGATWIPSARNDVGEKAGLIGASAGASLVWLARPTLNLLVETLYTRSEDVAGPGQAETADALVVSPGFRWARNFRSGLQVVSGAALPIGIGPSRGQTGVFLYLSFEHPFQRVER